MRNHSLGRLIVGGSIVAAGTLLWRRAHAATRLHENGSPSSAQPSSPPPAGWVVPVPTLADRSAVVSNEFHASTQPNDPHEHLGVDIMFRRRDARDLIAMYPAGSTNGSKLFFMPEGVSALAAAPGAVSFAAMTGMGNSVIIQHASGWATYYTHLSSLAVKRGDVVHAGQSLGTIGASPTDSHHLKHLHFELWKGGKRSGATDPKPFLETWRRMTSPWSPTLVASASTLRNGATSSYRLVGDRGGPYPEWVRALKGKAGVYIIRDATTRECLYVGSSAGRLYDTLTRHFQTWRRWKGFWKGQYGEGADPGLTYPRAAVEVAVRLTSPGDALDEEMRTIARLRPRDNQIGQPESATDETVPF